MGLTDEEKHHLNYDKLSADLKNKLDAVFCSPYFSSVLALWMLKSALENEIIEEPFTIRGSTTLELSDKGVESVIKEAITSRQNVEVALKVAKWLMDAADDIAKMQSKLIPEEKSEAEVILSGNAEEIRKKIREKHNGIV